MFIKRILNVLLLFESKFFRIVCLIFIPAGLAVADYGYLEHTSSLIQFAEEETEKSFGSSVLQDLNEYRSQIRQSAYETTLRLCTAYRIAVGMGLPEYHKKVNSSEYLQHADPRVRQWAENLNRQYGDTVSSSMQAWLKTAYEGGVQPFTIIFGNKADYLAETHTGIFELKAWFYSLYTMYLVDSLGFLSAAVHCLGTHEVDEVNRFAVAVMMFDSAASIPGHLVFMWTGGMILKGLWRASKWSFRPVLRMASATKQRLNHVLQQITGKPVPVESSWSQQASHTVAQWLLRFLPYTTRRNTLITGGVGGGGIGGVWITDIVRDRFKQREILEEEIAILTTEGRDWDQVKRMHLLNQVFQIFAPIYQEEQNKTTPCSECYNPFYDFVSEQFTEETLALMKQDFSDLQESEEYIGYLTLLEHFLPVVEEAYQYR